MSHRLGAPTNVWDPLVLSMSLFFYAHLRQAKTSSPLATAKTYYLRGDDLRWGHAVTRVQAPIEDVLAFLWDSKASRVPEKERGKKEKKEKERKGRFLSFLFFLFILGHASFSFSLPTHPAEKASFSFSLSNAPRQKSSFSFSFFLTESFNGKPFSFFQSSKSL